MDEFVLPHKSNWKEESKELFKELSEYKLITVDGKKVRDIPKEKKERYRIIKAEIARIHMKMVLSFTKKFHGGFHQTPEDAFQNGFIGLMNAVDRYDCERTSEFTTCAFNWIRLSVRRNSVGRDLIKIPENIADYNWKNKIQQFQMSNIDNQFNLTSKNENIIDNIYKSEVKVMIEKELSKLNSREANIIRYRYGIDCEPKTLEEISSIFNISRERTRQIEGSAMKKLVKRMVKDEKSIS